MSITVYSQPGCQPCKATYRYLDRAGMDYTAVDLAEHPEATEYIRSLGYAQAPVVVADNQHWSGYKVDKLNEL